MSWRFLFFCCLLFPVICNGQVLEGIVLDKEYKTPVFGVNIRNLHSGKVTTSDSEGHYHIIAAAGDTVLFRHTTYLPYYELMTYTMRSKFKSILLQQSVVQLKEATITGMTKYQQDSTERHLLYYHELNRQLVPNPKFTGLGCAGCIGWIADKITGNSKQSKRFRKEFADEDKERYIDSRYTIELVRQLTSFIDSDTVVAFIHKYPMEYDFARVATDLEIKAWIRYNYKDYLQKGQKTKEEK